MLVLCSKVSDTAYKFDGCRVSPPSASIGDDPPRDEPAEWPTSSGSSENDGPSNPTPYPSPYSTPHTPPNPIPAPTEPPMQETPESDPEDSPTAPLIEETPEESPIDTPTAPPAEETGEDDPADTDLDLGAAEEEQPVNNESESAQTPMPEWTTTTPTAAQKDELSVGAIIGIACGVLVVILIILYYESRRRNLTRQVGYLSQASSSEGGNGKSTLDDGSADKDKGSVAALPSVTKKRKSAKSSKSRYSPVDDVKDAINKADWDSVYRLASQLAEDDDLSLSSMELTTETIHRSHLGREDQGRTRTLDDLLAKGDWTGLAVTAALYAGESGSSHKRRSKASGKGSKGERSLVVANSSGKGRLSDADADGDWNRAQEISEEMQRSRISYQMSASVPTRYQSSSVQDVELGQASMEYLVGGLSSALNAGDWAQVNYFANIIKEEKGQSGSFASGEFPDTKAMVVASGSSRISLAPSNDSSDADLSKKQTIEKLVRAQKWKGVSIMANLYEMESKQNAPVVGSQASSSRQRSSRTSSSSTKELRHSDRVDDNIVGFRREG
jgi:hypothetical protein